MACASCGRTSSSRVVNTAPAPKIESYKGDLIVGKSVDNTKVKLRYNGGAMALQTSGCASCGSRGKYAVTTSETIQFVSDDAPGGWFKQRFDIGRDYYVTKEQAKKLLEETFTNPAGQVVHKFKVLEDNLL